MITAQFILFFFAFLIICMFVMGALNRDLRDKRYLSTMGCLLSVIYFWRNNNISYIWHFVLSIFWKHSFIYTFWFFTLLLF